MPMIASGAGWPAGGSGSGAGVSGGSSGRRGAHAGHGDEAVRPVQSTDALTDRSRGDRTARPSQTQQDAAQDAAHGASHGSSHAASQGVSRDRAQASADAPGQPGGGRALVPVSPAGVPAAFHHGASHHGAAGHGASGRGASGQGASGQGGGHGARVPVATAPRLSVPVAADGALAVQVAGGAEAMAARETGSGAGARGDSWPGRAPGSAAAVSDSYRRRGGLPPMGMGSGVIFRLSI